MAKPKSKREKASKDGKASSTSDKVKEPASSESVHVEDTSETDSLDEWRADLERSVSPDYSNWTYVELDMSNHKSPEFMKSARDAILRRDDSTKKRKYPTLTEAQLDAQEKFENSHKRPRVERPPPYIRAANRLINRRHTKLSQEIMDMTPSLIESFAKTAFFNKSLATSEFSKNASSNLYELLERSHRKLSYFADLHRNFMSTYYDVPLAASLCRTISQTVPVIPQAMDSIVGVLVDSQSEIDALLRRVARKSKSPDHYSDMFGEALRKMEHTEFSVDSVVNAAREFAENYI
ncbi:hypothetical protein BJ508DRAFT_315321 [Ascobolus immersus RN42]|uniref:Uncharacterized protein n=1 Tax=Ascobolus immersus RN42 TaxID=1160509 RepID=A0A3N4HDR5_ASCIM|nr:hypothetical protein BJ508DRAFT_315321 [Ascobolus immersus RN42]